MASDGDDSGTPNEGGVLSPDELDITDDDRVAEIDDGRFVISPGEGTPVTETDDSGFDFDADPNDDADADDEAPSELTEAAVRAWLEEQLESNGARFGFDVTAKFDGGVERQELFSNDVVTAFENLVMWYAQHAGGDTPVEQVLGLLLTEANVPVRYPPETVKALAAAKGLAPDDTIGDLVAAYEDEGVRFPP